MADFTALANDVIADATISRNIDASLKKIANENGLSIHESQRLVENTNIGLFLNKMQDGSQHEDFPLASPVEIEQSSTSGGASSLAKVASARQNFEVSAYMFDLSADQELVKTASTHHGTDANYHILNSEDKWEEAKALNIESRESLLQKEAEALGNRTIEGFLAGLALSIRGDADLVKTAIALVHEDDNSFIHDVMAITNLIDDEILDGTVSSDSVAQLQKVATEEWDKSLLKLSASSAGDTLDATVNLVKYPFKNPKTALALLGTGYVAKKALGDEREIIERKKMMHIEQENRNA